MPGPGDADRVVGPGAMGLPAGHLTAACRSVTAYDRDLDRVLGVRHDLPVAFRRAGTRAPRTRSDPPCRSSQGTRVHLTVDPAKITLVPAR